MVARRIRTIRQVFFMPVTLMPARPGVQSICDTFKTGTIPRISKRANCRPLGHYSIPAPAPELLTRGLLTADRAVSCLLPEGIDHLIRFYEEHVRDRDGPD